MKITFNARLSVASTRQFVSGSQNSPVREDSQIDFAIVNEGAAWERDLYKSDSQILATIDFSCRQIARKTLSVRKNFTGNINLSQTSRLNLDKFGIGNDIPVITDRHCSQTIGLMVAQGSILRVVHSSKFTHFNLIIDFGLESFQTKG